MNLQDLKKPFPADEIEWRLAQCGKKSNGQFWAMCLAYVDGRAILDRLDEVCGPDNWKVSYRFVAGSQGIAAGVMGELSILVGDKWVTKEDGAEQTDIESFKGGISSALKRAGSVWGIGRYLYSLEAGFATICDPKQSGARWGQTKEKAEFYWLPPTLPDWALPKQGATSSPVKPLNPEDARPIQSGVYPGTPGPEDGVQHPEEYEITFGQWKRLTIDHVLKTKGPDALASYIRFLEDPKQAEKRAKEKPHLVPLVDEFIERASDAIAAYERGLAAEMGSRG